MPTIYKANSERISIADAKRLINETVPREKAIDVYAREDEHGNIDFDGPIELREVAESNNYAAGLDPYFLDACKALNMQPRMKYRPTFTDYRDASQDTYYTVSHDEFVKYAELYGASVAVGDAPEQADTQPQAGNDAPVVEVPDPERRLTALYAMGGTAKWKRSRGELRWVFTGIKGLMEQEKRKGHKRSDEKTIRLDLTEAAEAESMAKRSGEAWSR